MRFTRRRPDRSDPARRRLGSSLESLERRELLTTTTVNDVFSPWFPRELPVSNPITHQPVLVTVDQLVNRNNPDSPLLNNEGKVVSGKDRAGDEWTITVHGPGIAVVTDTSPNDGILDDNINSIQLVGTDPNTTYVTGEVFSSYRVPTNGTVLFNSLSDVNGVKSIVLNGFTLADTVSNLINYNNPNTPIAENSGTGIFLLGGVGYLQFHDILAPIDTGLTSTTGTGLPTPQPINIIIGDPSTPLTVAPVIRLDSIWNTVFNSTAATVPTNPLTTPTVNIVVNGQIKSLDYISSTMGPYVDPAQVQRAANETRLYASQNTFDAPHSTSYSYSLTTLTDAAGNTVTETPLSSTGQIGAASTFSFPVVGTTGRTAVRAIGINNLNVRGSAVNTTFSRGAVPFTNSFSGLNYLNRARFGGTADALGIDVNGPIGSLVFRRGVGNPIDAGSGTNVNATTFGTPISNFGYPASGLLGGLITARRIGNIHAGPANVLLQVPTNPNYVQLFRQGETAYFPRAGNALTNTVIASAGSIRRVHILGSQQNTEITTGFDYPSFEAGLIGQRAPSQIGRFQQRGSLIDSMDSSTYRPFNHSYYSAQAIAGPGRIRGALNGWTYSTGAVTGLGDAGTPNSGVGFFARRKIGYLPPPQAATRVNSIPVGSPLHPGLPRARTVTFGGQTVTTT